MSIEQKPFFDAVRDEPFGGALTHGQVDGMSRILDEWEQHKELTDKRFLAYMLATVYWETAHQMQPIRELGSDAYLRSKKYYPWIGEGLVQVTWEANARKFGAQKPGDLLTWPIALVALFKGMTDGMFTGKKLADYFNDTHNDPIGARRIINGQDRAQEIAEIYEQFLSAM